MNNVHWSIKDYDPKYVSNGVRANLENFSINNSVFTNDPQVFKEQVDNSKRAQNMITTFYQYYHQDDKRVGELNLQDRKATFSAGR
jgi:hypothetical protein